MAVSQEKFQLENTQNEIKTVYLKQALPACCFKSLGNHPHHLNKENMITLAVLWGLCTKEVINFERQIGSKLPTFPPGSEVTEQQCPVEALELLSAP